MAGDSKFVQISAAAVVQIEGQVYEQLFALDNEGDVWQYQFQRGGARKQTPIWVPLSSERKK